MGSSADRAQRVASIALGLAASGLAAALAFLPVEASPKRRAADAAADAPTSTIAAAPAADAGEPGDADVAVDAEVATTEPLVNEAGALDKAAPKTVKLGVVLVQWSGAEGAPASARPRAQADDLARRLAETAQGDFRRAVLDGDPGSSEDIGRVPRGVLDPRTELAVFNLAVGETAGPLATPRGYWIVKRFE